MDNATFRTNFTEFASTTTYPEAMLTFWTSVAGNYVSASKWGDAYDIGMSLVLAHLLVTATANQSGGTGSGVGLSNSESAGDVSIGYDTANYSEKDGGHWNTTSYGRQYLRMAKFMGGCARQI